MRTELYPLKRRSAQFPVRSSDHHADFKNSPNNSLSLCSMLPCKRFSPVWDLTMSPLTALPRREGFHSPHSDPSQTNQGIAIYWSSSWAKRGAKVTECTSSLILYAADTMEKEWINVTCSVPWHAGSFSPNAQNQHKVFLKLYRLLDSPFEADSLQTKNIARLLICCIGKQTGNSSFSTLDHCRPGCRKGSHIFRFKINC